MLTIKQNFIETITGGNPDRYVKNFEYMAPIMDPMTKRTSRKPEVNTAIQTDWGYWKFIDERQPGSFPLHDDEHKLLKDICDWREVIKAPDFEALTTPEEWEECRKKAESIDRNEYLVAAFVMPGIFEDLHYFMGMEDALINFIEEPEEMHALIDYLVDWEITLADKICDTIHPDLIFHHDDWGSQQNSFLDPEMFAEFFVPAYKRLYGHWRELGVQYVVHHSDSYAANLIPAMLEIGIDVFQGAHTSNNLPEIIAKYGGQISFMGGINNGEFDRPDTKQEEIHEYLLNFLPTLPNNGKLYFIPGLLGGGGSCTFNEVYEMCNVETDKMSELFF